VNRTNIEWVRLPEVPSVSSGDLLPDVRLTSADVRTDVTTNQVECSLHHLGLSYNFLVSSVLSTHTSSCGKMSEGTDPIGKQWPHLSSWNPPKSDILYTDVRICQSAELSSWNPPNLETYNTKYIHNEPLFWHPLQRKYTLPEREGLPPSILDTVAVLPLLESVPSAQTQHHQQDIRENVRMSIPVN